ncbi:MAG: hypothetical protein U9P11_02330, partial [Pseudomonadota bacterium]|nr:hypothetical protein [Pseudomonadota bacterium]
MDKDKPSTKLHPREAIIRTAFYRSLWVLLLFAGIGAGIWFLSREDSTPEVIEEATVSGPVIEAAAPLQGPPAVVFTDITREAGIDFVHVNGAYGEKLIPEAIGSGLAFFDYDKDGDQ